MITKYTAILSIFLVTTWSCSDTSKTTTKTETTTVVGASYPSVPKATMEMLWEKCTHIDYIFTDLPYSISVDDNQQSRAMLLHISTNPAVVDNNCPLTANVVYLASGEIVLEANLYYNKANQCKYMVFLENGQPKYANYLTPDGLSYFDKLISSVKVVPGQ